MNAHSQGDWRGVVGDRVSLDDVDHTVGTW